jgi:hypothetical protein
MKKHWAVVLPLLALGCEGPKDVDQDGIVDGVRNPDSVSVVAPATPKGTVSGQVLNTRMEPLAGVSVRMTIGSATTEQPLAAETDASGNFMFKNVPAGSQVLVTLAKDGYATLRASAEVPSSAGNVPINNGNASLGAITLAQLNGTVRFTLITPSGRPAVGAQAFIEAAPAGTISFNGTTVTAVSTVVASAVADAQGVVTFTRVPAPVELARIGGTGTQAGGYRLWVDPVDLPTADGILDAGGYAKKIDASALMVYGGSQLIQLPAPRSDAGNVDPSNPGAGAGFNIVATNVPSLNHAVLTDATQKALARQPLRNMVRPGDSIYLSFGQPVARDSLFALLTDEAGQKKLDVTVTPNATGDVFTLTPAAGTLQEGQEYNLSLRATSAYDGTLKTWKGFFVSGDANTPKPLQVASIAFKDSNKDSKLGNGECVVVTFNQMVRATPITSPRPEVFFNVDLSSTPGPVGDSPGEYGHANGFVVVAAAPPSADLCFSGETTAYPVDSAFNEFTTRFSIPSGYPGSVSVSEGVEVKVDFAKFRSTELSNYYETAWGVPVPSTTALKTTLTRLP